MLQQAEKIRDQLVEWRRDLHSHPELSFQESRTARVVADNLERLGYSVRTQVGKTGVTADMGQGYPMIAVRADMDALPIFETNEVSYASRNPGVMHACGHDAHTAIALGAATLLAGEAFKGSIRFLFQPAEEDRDAEGFSGAQRMVQDGAMEGVDAVLALHVDASSVVGKVKVSAGPMTAGGDTFRGVILGKGGHGGYPERAVDPIYLAGFVILSINGIVSRRIGPGKAAVIGLGTIRAGELANVIPDHLEMSGTIRYRDPAVQEIIHKELDNSLQITRSMGGDYQLDIQTGNRPVMNDPEITELVRKVSADLLGPDCFKEPEYGMAGEDFSVMTALAPGMMFSLGCASGGEIRPHHNPKFDIDERCLPIGTAIISEAVLRFLGKRNND
ncbi:MAG: amidohydrolase [Anaerolineales bacterium]|nr:amidohydrolase [Anaerolineales bacterium]